MQNTCVCIARQLEMITRELRFEHILVFSVAVTKPLALLGMWVGYD